MKNILPACLCALSVLLLGVNGCMNETVTSELQQVDSLMQLLKKAELKLHEVNRDTVDKKYKLYGEYSARIDTNAYRTKNDEAWHTICAYGNTRKAIKIMHLGYSVFQQEIDSSGVRLEGLKHDVRKKMIGENDFRKYYASEKENALHLLMEITLKTDNCIRAMAAFDTVHPRIAGIIDRSAKNKHK
jgi:hypothetical protein